MNLEYINFEQLERLANEGFTEELTKLIKQIIENGDKDVRRIIATYNNLPKEIKDILYNIDDKFINAILKVDNNIQHNIVTELEISEMLQKNRIKIIDNDMER